MTTERPYASPPCYAAEVDPTYFDPLAVDPVQARDVARWRRAMRQSLSDMRRGLGQAELAAKRDQLAQHLEATIAAHLKPSGSVLSGYWPIRSEFDLRPLLARFHERNITIALPVVEVRAAPLIFRRWTPQTRMVRGDWNIPVPPADAEIVTPDILLAPCLGWDEACFRLGWGGGYFDRTLATATGPRIVIGVALKAARLTTIYPQPHDIPMDLIVTEDGLSATRECQT